MTRPAYSTILLSILFLALMLALPSARLMAQTAEEYRSVERSSSSVRSTTEVPMDEQRSVTTTTRSMTEAPPPVEEHRSVTTSTSSTKEAPPAQKPTCLTGCRDQYDKSMTERNQPGHPDRKDCEEWAKEREEKCLKICYRR